MGGILMEHVMNTPQQETYKDPIESLSKSERDKLFNSFIILDTTSKKYIHIGTDLKNPLVNNIYINLVDTFSSCTVFSSMTAIVSLVNYIKSQNPTEFEKIKNCSIQTAYCFFTKVNTVSINQQLGLNHTVDTNNSVLVADASLNSQPDKVSEDAEATSSPS